MSRFLVFTVFAFGLCACSSGVKTDETSREDDARNHISNVADSSRTEHNLFGVKVFGDETSVINQLAEAGVLSIDTLDVVDDEFQSAVVEFAGVKFGMNKGFMFITSTHDSLAIKSLTEKISSFYGAPESDGDDEPEYRYYCWYPGKPHEPLIRIRPLYSDDGGLVMFWEF